MGVKSLSEEWDRREVSMAQLLAIEDMKKTG